MTELERLRAVLDSIQIGIVAVDTSGTVELQTAEASRILGVSARVTRGAALAEVLGPRHPAVQLLREGLGAERDVWMHAASIEQRMGKEPLTVDLAVSPVRRGDGEAIGVQGAVLTLRDRTLGQQLEAHVAQRMRSELFARLAAGIAHEIRNPLGGIRGAAELLLGKLVEPELRRYPELIRDETDRVRRLLDDLSQLTDQRDPATRPLNLHRILDDLLELQRHDEVWREIDVAREYDPSIPDVELDPDRIAQALLNLMRNAAQAMGGKGRLVVRTRVDPSLRISDETHTAGGVVRIEFEDTGPGIAEDDLPHIFTPFFSRRADGTGLGLAIAQHWVVRHGGRIQPTSRAGQGTCMRVLLPIRRNGGHSA